MRDIIIIIKKERREREGGGASGRETAGERLRARLPFAVLLKWRDNAGCRNTDKLPCSATQPKSVVCGVGEVDGEGTYEALARQSSSKTPSRDQERNRGVKREPQAPSPCLVAHNK